VKFLIQILFLILIFSEAFFAAPVSKTDSLEAVLKKVKDKREKVIILSKLAEEYSALKNPRSFDLLDEAESIAQKNNFSDELLMILNQKAKFLIVSNPEKCYEISMNVIERARRQNNKKEEAEALLNIGRFYVGKSIFDQAIDYFRKSLLIKESLGDTKGCGDLRHNIGYVFVKMGNNQEAINYFTQSLEDYKKINERKEEAGVLVQIGNIYFYKGDYFKAVGYYQNSLQIAELLKDTVMLGKSFQMMGIVHHEWGKYEEAIEYYKKSLDCFEKLKHRQGTANNFINIGLVYVSMNKTKFNDNTNVEISKKLKLNDKTWRYNNEKSLEYFKNAHAIMKDLKDKKGICNTLNSIGQTYLEAEDHKTAIAYFDTALSTARNLNDKMLVMQIAANIGQSYSKINKPEVAEKYFHQALDNAKEMEMKTYITQMYMSLGQLYTKIKKYDLALQNLQNSLELVRQIQAKEYLGKIYEAFATLYEKTGNYKGAYEYFKLFSQLKDSLMNEQSLKLITEVETKYQTEKKEAEIKILNTSNELKENQKNQLKLVLWVFVVGFILIIVFSVLLFRQFNEKKKANIILAQQKTEILEKNEELQQQKEEIQAQAELVELQNHELEKLSIVASKTDNAVIIADGTGKIEWVNEGFTHLFGYKFSEFVEKKGDNLIAVSSNPNFLELLNQSIKEGKSVVYTSLSAKRDGEKIWLQTTLTPIVDYEGNCVKIITIDSDITKIKLAEQEVEKQRDIALKQRDLIGEQKKEITDSINYACQIQSAVIPSTEIIAGKVSDYFVLFKPRDIVSGDFYWATTKENKLVVAAVDCTGHGVPGAFMSMLGIAFLNEIVNRLFEKHGNNLKACGILNELRERVITSLHQTGKLGENQDGMDMALCIIDTDTNQLQYAGANNPLYLIRNNVLTEFKADKMPIGIHYTTLPFTNNIIDLQKNDTVYIFSDGYADQFGGESGTKFKKKSFQEMLVKLQDFSMPEQKKKLEQQFDNWKGIYEQIDDIIVIGLRI